MSDEENEESGDEQLRLYGDYRVRAFDTDGMLIQSTKVENTGKVEIEGVFENTVVNQIDRIVVEPLAIEARVDGKTDTRIETGVEKPIKPQE